ncbi:DEAD/DEAH box helicase [Neomicrococcus aestuarii]|uniref:DEAD/DEAH box helicase n=1 Tax=Neomicrococcus aestuarii TaxID=556325 RepID=UPI000A077E82|nr:DEAD/DEAH box helicase [Neomicrococcus aestuarii]
MTELLPTRQARNLVDGLRDYLTTTFTLSDEKAQRALGEFLTHPEHGMFKGPYVRLRLPFEAAQDEWRESLDFMPGKFDPYGHQAQAFARLTSKSVDGRGMRRPEPTLVTTGTGSGKTESFLYPILDHVLRAQKAGITGVKALILYPMNALANDQAGRLSKLISGTPELRGIRAGLYTGQSGPTRSLVTPDGLINDRYVLRQNPPDILLTNYKMLDMLLLRNEDAQIWKDSATSLQYVVLDEFHTYDGAQGTDVAMLLRRLGLTLKSHWPQDLSSVGLTEIDRARPLGKITPVATSATLGGASTPGDGSNGSTEMLRFAETILGEKLGRDALVTESRMSFATWRDVEGSAATSENRELADLAGLIDETNQRVRADASHESLISAAIDALFVEHPGADPTSLLRALRHHPLTERLVRETSGAVVLRELAARLFPTADTDEAEEFLSHLLALYSHVRATAGRGALTVETHLWVRELSRIDSVVDVSYGYRWGDDGVDEAELEAQRVYLPAIYCRHCGKYGWGAMLAPTGSEVEFEATDIRMASLTKDSSFRALIHAAGEADAVFTGEKPALIAKEDGLRYLHTARKTLLGDAPDLSDPDYQRGGIIPVLVHVGKEAGDLSRKDTCPSCMSEDAIRFVGSAIATLTSVAVSTLFGASGVPSSEKKALIFTDSVQDAAHRAGFIQARSHTFNLRTALRSAFQGGPGDVLTLSQLVDQAMATAPGHDSATHRFRLVPPALTDRPGFREYWDEKASPGDRARAGVKVKSRLRFDAALEMGLQARLGRTLELTGSVVSEVDAGSPAAVAAMARRAWDAKLHVIEGVSSPTDDELRAWVAGVLTRMRLQGGIHHEWLEKYIYHDGHRYHVWGGRPRHLGMPAFPKGRPAPAFPVIGTSKTENGLDPLTPRTSWYSVWTHRALGVIPEDTGYLVRELFEELARSGVLKEHVTELGAKAYSLPPERILLTAPDDGSLREKKHGLVCDTCKTRTVGTAALVDQLDGAPCLQIKCGGRNHRVALDPASFYRTMYAEPEGKRVVAREHTSLLDDALRLEYENGFKASDQKPDAPNVLVATPTLEMGIDIGDLSCVMLASMPSSVASYVQRVGRAGRLSGNSLVLAFVRGRGENLPKLNDPLSVINGDVRPPSTYLQAEEILHRQFVAYLGDVISRDTNAPHPTSARSALRSLESTAYLGHMLGLIDSRGAQLLDEFLGQFTLEHVSDEVRARLHLWCGDELQGQIRKASELWRSDQETLQQRIKDVEVAVEELKVELARAENDYGKDSDHPAVLDARRDLNSAFAQQKRLFQAAQESRNEYWISKIEMYGLFPNYTLIGDSVELEVGVSWRNEDTQQFEASTETFARGAGIAINELAPGATFYAQGMEIKIDAVDLGPDLQNVQYWQICPACGWKNPVDRISEAPIQYKGVASVCVRCSANGIDDVGNTYGVVVLRKVSAELRRDEAAISDSRDDRARTRFHLAAIADIDPAHAESPWFVEQSKLGAEYLNAVDITWLNLGEVGRGGTTVTMGGRDYQSPRFSLCEYCGKQDNNARSNTKNEHRFWCRLRKASEERSRPLLLARELRTQGVKLHLPATANDVDAFALPTLKTALLLGLREHLGGTPGHFGIMTIPDFTGTQNEKALLIHDTVPGGTGYLASFKSPLDVFNVLVAALKVVSNCECAEQNRRACHKCLLPFADYTTVDFVSRVEAKRLLEDLLGIEDGDVPDFESWTILDAPVQDLTGESSLEISFRKALKARLAAVNADVTSKPGPWGERLRIKLPGQNFSWTLEPQEMMGDVRPDFVLRHEDPNIPVVAIFTDGRAFHASPVANRLADDAAKRFSLKLRGIIPWALTHQDVERFSDAAADVQGDAESSQDAWIMEALVPTLTKKYSFSPGILAAMRQGSMDLLWQWINHPDKEAWTKFADVAAAFAMGSFERSDVSAASLRDFQFGSGWPTPPHVEGTPWWSREGKYLQLVAAGHPMQVSHGSLRALLSLDDSAEAVASEGFADEWRRWLFWSNLFAFQTSPKTTLIGTRSARDEILADAGFNVGAADVVMAPVNEGSALVIDPAWQPFIEEAYDDEERAILKKLGAAKLPVPDAVGEEVDGVATLIVWSEQKIAVIYEPDEDQRLIGKDWTVMTMEEVDSIQEQDLKSAFGMGSVGEESGLEE